MTVYIILFRGVGGATQLPTKPLREALTAAGFKDVATYINSGNAVLSSQEGRRKRDGRSRQDLPRRSLASTRQSTRSRGASGAS